MYSRLYTGTLILHIRKKSLSGGLLHQFTERLAQHFIEEENIKRVNLLEQQIVVDLPL